MLNGFQVHQPGRRSRCARNMASRRKPLLVPWRRWRSPVRRLGGTLGPSTFPYGEKVGGLIRWVAPSGPIRWPIRAKFAPPRCRPRGVTRLRPNRPAQRGTRWHNPPGSARGLTKARRAILLAGTCPKSCGQCRASGQPGPPPMPQPWMRLVRVAGSEYPRDHSSQPLRRGTLGPTTFAACRNA